MEERNVWRADHLAQREQRLQVNAGEETGEKTGENLHVG